MRRIKEMMKGLRKLRLTIPNGYVEITKELAHWFDEELNEHYCYLYKLEQIKNDEYKEMYL